MGRLQRKRVASLQATRLSPLRPRCPACPFPQYITPTSRSRLPAPARPSFISVVHSVTTKEYQHYYHTNFSERILQDFDETSHKKSKKSESNACGVRTSLGSSGFEIFWEGSDRRAGMAPTVISTGLGVLAGALFVKCVMDQMPMAGGWPRCPTCNGTGRVSCLCARWSDGDVGCRTCGGSGRMVCSSCGGTGNGRPLPVPVRPAITEPGKGP